MQQVKVCKFGGSSVSTSESLKKIVDIILSDDTRKYIVVSAPGKRFKEDTKVTDLLFKCYNELLVDGNCDATYDLISQRFISIAHGNTKTLDVKALLDSVKQEIYQSKDCQAFVISRGEYIMARIMADTLGFPFVDSKDLIRFDGMDNLNTLFTNEKIKTILANYPVAVIPGFYGMNSIGRTVIFSRGGGDVSGALVARGVSACVYENWTDVDGFLVADPRIVDDPRIIKRLTYREIRELSYMGANVIHQDAMFPVKVAGIPINIRNTFNPSAQGTMIMPKREYIENDDEIVTGIAGKKGFSIIHIEKAMINGEVGFIRRVLTVLEHYGIVLEHIPSSIDSISLVIANESLRDCNFPALVEEIRESVEPDNISIHEDIALIATVGAGIPQRTNIGARMFGALAAADISVQLIDMGASELNVIIGVYEKDFEKAIRTIYSEFIR